MRTREELLDMVKRIDVSMDKDPEYFRDVKAAIDWVLRKISAGQETTKIEKELKWIDNEIGRMMDLECENVSEDVVSNTAQRVVDFLADNEVEGWYGVWFTVEGKVEGLGTGTLYNIADAFGWILGTTSTKIFLSNYLELARTYKSISVTLDNYLKLEEKKLKLTEKRKKQNRYAYATFNDIIDELLEDAHQ